MRIKFIGDVIKDFHGGTLTQNGVTSVILDHDVTPDGQDEPEIFINFNNGVSIVVPDSTQGVEHEGKFFVEDDDFNFVLSH